MKVVVASLFVIGALAGLAVNWPLPPRAAVAEPGLRRPIPAARVASARHPMTSSSTSRPAIVPDDGATLIRTIQRALVSVDADERERALTNELPALIAIDAKSAGELVARTEPGPVRDVLRARVVRLWAAADLNGAMDWVKALDDAGERRLAASDVATEIATSDPATALEVFDIFGIGRADGTLEHVVQLWAEEHLQEALDYAQAQERSPTRDQLLARIAAVQAARDPAAAAALVTHEITPGAVQRDAIFAVTRQWATRDADAALNWVATLADASLRERAKAEIARTAAP
jgi:hypothetical protein